MKIDFTELQKIFIEKIKKEENLTLTGKDVSFEINPNYEFESYNLTVRLKIFGEEFSVGYPKRETTVDELITDFYSRLHDYSTDHAGNHIIGLKILQLENEYADQFSTLRENIVSSQTDIKPEDLFIDISDTAPYKTDKRGFPNFDIFIYLKKKLILTRTLGFYEYNHKLGDELESKIIPLIHQ